eukprot:TRINITY_DN6024_c0_g1_i1.p3 TRINITY_DN6024_c0_g1~~TRINITY_DN6024_c0_g1_i1.p3  ORF type:complete len:108 (-),score=17.69 TRINITY_DN6024_c0_g1_i1:358-681(-)
MSFFHRIARACLCTALVASTGAAAAGGLGEGDVCYRFCENGSKEPVMRRGDCEQGLQCKTTLPPGMVSFDSCNHPYVCKKSGGGKMSDSDGCDDYYYCCDDYYYCVV